MDFIGSLIGVLIICAILALIITLLFNSGGKKYAGDPSFFDKFIKTYFIILGLMLLGLLLDKAGCGGSDIGWEYDHPVK